MEAASYSLSGESERILDSTVVQEYAYVYNGSSLMQMVVQTTVDDGEPVTETLYFSYDATGNPMSVLYNGTDYYYTVSLQGDVTAILNTSGTAVVEYTYDAWGNILTVTGSMADTLGQLNPLTYRGYVYDTETGLYYLQSRCYNPETGRFLNAEGYTSKTYTVCVTILDDVNGVPQSAIWKSASILSPPDNELRLTNFCQEESGARRLLAAFGYSQNPLKSAHSIG